MIVPEGNVVQYCRLCQIYMTYCTTLSTCTAPPESIDPFSVALPQPLNKITLQFDHRLTSGKPQPVTVGHSMVQWWMHELFFLLYVSIPEECICARQ